MLNKQQLRQQVIQYYRSVGSGENIIQCIKQALFLHESFNPVIVFEMISRGKQKLTKDDIRNYLTQKNIQFSEEELRYFCRINNFDHGNVTLNEFLEAMIPYNADVIREFKAKYLEVLQIKGLDPEVQFIFAELMSNWIRFLRSMIKIRSEISNIATRKQIEQLVKEDLVLRSKPRQARKFHETFQTRQFQLSFHELRKFLQIWISTKEIIHEFYLLNVKRHIKCDNPFAKIVFKGHKGSRSKSQKRERIQSAQKINSKPLKFEMTNEKIKEKVNDGYGEDQTRSHRNFGESNSYKKSGDKYQNFKRSIMDDFVKEQHGLSPVHKNNSKNGKNSSVKPRDEAPNEQLRRSRYERDTKGIDGTYIVRIFQEIVLKEERLEKLRKHLAKLNDFNLINLFKLIDDRNLGFITSKSLSDYTGDSRVQFNHLINFHAREKDKLRFQEFCIFFRPLSKQLNQSIDRRPEHKVPNPFRKQTSKLILEVLHLSGELYTNIYRLKETINRSGISPVTLFQYVSLDNKNYITADCIKQVLEENNIFCQAKDIKCLMKLFRKKVDERISQKEFIQFIDL